MAQSDKPSESTAAVVVSPATDEAPVADSEAAPKAAKSGGKFTLFIALLAFLLAAASAGWQGYQFWLEQFAVDRQPWVEHLSKLESQLDTRLRDQQGNYQQADSVLREGFEAEQKALAERIQSFQGATEGSLSQQLQSITWVKQRQQALDERLQDLVKLSREDWILAEADYLMRLAQQRLQLGGTGSDAGPLLQAAQRNLLLVHDKGIERVREVLAADIAAVSEARQFDLVGLDKRIAAVAEQAQALVPLGDRTLRPSPVAEAATAAPEMTLETLWPLIKYGFARAADKLQSYIRISDRDSAYQTTVIAGGQRELFRQHLQLLFEQARWALHSGNEALYAQALARSEEWLRQYYAAEEAEQAVLKELAELKQQPVRALTPAISASIAALQHFIDSRHGAAGGSK